MKKGEVRKKEILSTAELLFCKKGYEQTSVQDILDRLKSSKGSFYHHFPSKESLLEGICKKRAEEVYLITKEKIENDENILSNLDNLFSGMIPLCSERIAFLLMLLSIFHLPEGKLIRIKYCESLAGQFRSDVITQIKKGHHSGALFCDKPEIATDIVLLLLNNLWVNISDHIISAEENGKEPDLAEQLNIVDQYRFCIEKILTLPYGSMSLTDIDTLRQVTDQIHNHWKKTNVL